MKICDDDPFFSVDVPVLRIRRSTPGEATRREQRWARCRVHKLRLDLELAAKGLPESKPLTPGVKLL